MLLMAVMSFKVTKNHIKHFSHKDAFHVSELNIGMNDLKYFPKYGTMEA